MKLSKKAARRLSFAMMAHKTAGEILNGPDYCDIKYRTWCAMRDEALFEVVGMDFDTMHKKGHSKC